MEQPFEPADELRLRHPDLRLGRHPFERRRQSGELVLQVTGQDLGELADRPVVDVGEAPPAGVVERGLPGLAMRSSLAGSVMVSWPASGWASAFGADARSSTGTASTTSGPPPLCDGVPGAVGSMVILPT